MVNKKLTSACLLLLSLLTVGCSGGEKTLEKPDSTNLTHWIKEEVSEEAKAKMTLIPNYLGGIGEYLNAAYEAPKNESDAYYLPPIHVSYYLTAKDDISKEGNFVNGISITDPKITVYGLTMASTEDTITSTMSGLGFTGDSVSGWSKSGCTFFFSSTKIQIA